MQKNISKLEQNIATMMLSMPKMVSVVRIDPQWFSNPNFADLYRVINNDIDGSIPQWHSKCRLNYPRTFHMTTDYMYHLQNGMSKYAQYSNKGIKTLFKKSILDLRNQYLTNSIWRIANKMHRDGMNPEARRQMNNYLQLSGNLESNTSHFDQTQDGYDEFIKQARHKDTINLRTGFHELDYVLGGLDDDLLLDVSAPTGTGKTAFCVNICDNILRSKPNMRIDYFSAEMGSELMLERFVSHRTGISDFELRRPHDRLSAPDNALAQVTMKNVKDSGLHIYVGSQLDKILNTIRINASQRKPGTYLAVIDHVNIINVPGGNREPESVQISTVTRNLKELTTTLHIPIIMQSQLNRASQYKDTNKLELQDLKGSSSIEQDSNSVILLYKADKQPKNVTDNSQDKDQSKDVPTNMVANVAKNRSGITEEIPFKFVGSRMLFVEDYKGDNADKVIDQFDYDDNRREVRAREDLKILRNHELDQKINKYFKDPNDDDYYKIESNELVDKFLNFETKILQEPGFIRQDTYVQCGNIEQRATKLADKYNRVHRTDYDFMVFIKFIPGHKLFDEVTHKVLTKFAKHYHINFDKKSQNNGKSDKQIKKPTVKQGVNSNTSGTKSSTIDSDGSNTSLKEARQIVYDVFGVK